MNAERRHAPTRPAHLERQHGVLASSEHERGIAAGEIIAARSHLPALRRKRAALDRDVGTDAEGVRRNAAQSHRDPWRRRLRSIHDWRIVEPCRDDIEIAVAVEIAEGDRVRDRAVGAEAPVMVCVGERHIVVVPERDAMCREAWKLALLTVPGNVVGANAQEGVRVANVPAVAIDDEQILEAVEVDVDERRSPGPVARGEPGEIGDVRPRAVTSGELQRIAHPLVPVRR